MNMDEWTPSNNSVNAIPSANDTGFTPSTFILNGIPGLEAYHFWLAVSLFTIYIFTFVGNCTLLLIIATAKNLQKPMYILISKLAIADLMMSSCVLPRMLTTFWFNETEIHFSSCLIQMFFVACSLALESSILSAMAFDRYVAVCNPLRYSTILTNSLIKRLAAAILTRCIVLTAPIPILTQQIPFCHRSIAHLYCEQMAVARLSCTDITLNSAYSLAVSYLVLPMDLGCIILSYILILRAVLHLSLGEHRLKAFSTSSSHVCVLLAFYVPLFLAMLLNRLNHKIPPYGQGIMSVTCLIFPPMMNPLIYGVTLKVFRQRMYEVFQKFGTHARLMILP